MTRREYPEQRRARVKRERRKRQLDVVVRAVLRGIRAWRMVVSAEPRVMMTSALVELADRCPSPWPAHSFGLAMDVPK